MALKEYDEQDIEKIKLVSTRQVEEKLDSQKSCIRVVYINNELDNAYSSELSENDWAQLKSSLDTPEYNSKLANLLKMESVFD